MGRVEGKVALVTGAARGQGRSHAVRLAEEGASIIAIDVCSGVGKDYPLATPADLAETVAQVERVGGRIIASAADVRDAAALKAAVDDGVAQLGRLDVVAANAGIGPVAALTVETDPADWQEMLDVNLTGVWNTARAAVPHLIAGGRGGAIVITSSGASLRSAPHIAAYSAAKHGLVGLMRTLAFELGQHGIRVTNVAPTQVATDMILNEPTFRLFCPDKEAPTQEDFAAVSQSMHMLPTPWVEPRDVSNAVLFLASDEARYITAITLPVDCGATQH